MEPTKKLLIREKLPLPRIPRSVGARRRCGLGDTCVRQISAESIGRPSGYGKANRFSVAGFGSLLSAITDLIWAMRRSRFSFASFGELGMLSPRMM